MIDLYVVFVCGWAVMHRLIVFSVLHCLHVISLICIQCLPVACSNYQCSLLSSYLYLVNFFIFGGIMSSFVCTGWSVTEAEEIGI